MFTAQKNYWTEMIEKMEETCKASMNAGFKMQNNVVGMMKDIVETNVKYASDFKGRAFKAQEEMLEMASENSKKMMGLYRENMENTLKAMNELYEKHQIRNEDFIQDVEKVWKDGMENYNRNVGTVSGMVSETVKKNSETMIDWYKEAFEKGMADFNRRMEELSKTE
ncbi:MAG: hypothetical protein LWY06_06535 [Firmicutes bacterium]|nr:hypothetical protein [Bacillota bacterium]